MLRRALGPGQLIATGVGCMIGAGIFLSTPGLAHRYGAPALFGGYLVAALACALTALCYAEFAAVDGGAGSAYSYARLTLGPRAAWLVAGALVLEYSFGAAAVANLWMSGPVGGAIASIGVAVLLAFGIRISAGLNTALVVLKCGVLAILVAGAFSRTGGRGFPFAFEGDWSAVAGPAVFSYLGFETVSTLGLECKRPARDLPFGVIGSLAVTTAIYLVVIAAYGAVMPPLRAEMAGMAPAFEPAARLAIAVGLSTVLIAMMMGQSRVFFAMAKDGALPAVVGRISESTLAPVGAIAVSGVAITVLCLTIPAGKLYDLAVIGTLIAFTAVAGVLPLLRRKQPRSTFRVPLIWLIAPAAVVVNPYIMARMIAPVAIELVIFAAVWIVAGIGINRTRG
ncbi:MAG: amino acid permease [Acidobacteria bacterium]|nr:amino acid permease [Acidobacteriota bacterium]